MLQELPKLREQAREQAVPVDSYVTTDVKQTIGWDNIMYMKLLTEFAKNSSVKQDALIFYMVDNTGRVGVVVPYARMPQQNRVEGAVLLSSVDLSEQSTLVERVDQRVYQSRTTSEFERIGLEGKQRDRLLDLMERVEDQYPERTRVAIVADNMENRYLKTMSMLEYEANKLEP